MGKLDALKELGWRVIKEVTDTIKNDTKDNPLNVFTLNEDGDPVDIDGELMDPDAIYDLPYGYVVGKYNEYFQGVVKVVNGNDVTLYMTGEEFGELWDTEVDQLPFETRVELLNFLMKRK